MHKKYSPKAKLRIRVTPCISVMTEYVCLYTIWLPHSSSMESSGLSEKYQRAILRLVWLKAPKAYWLHRQCIGGDSSFPRLTMFEFRMSQWFFGVVFLCLGGFHGADCRGQGQDTRVSTCFKKYHSDTSFCLAETAKI